MNHTQKVNYFAALKYIQQVRGSIFPSIVLLNFRQVHQVQRFMSKLVIYNMP